MSSVSFRGLEQTPNGNKYYKSNKGLQAGIVAGAFAGGINIASGVLGNFEGVPNKAVKKSMIPLALTAFAVSTACGAIVDAIRNKKAQETADKIATTNPKNLFMQVDNLEISRYGTPYYKSNDGKKWGALLGLGYGLITYLVGSKASGLKSISVIPTMLVGALDGLIMGAITDRMTNKAAEKNAFPKDFSVTL